MLEKISENKEVIEELRKKAKDLEALNDAYKATIRMVVAESGTKEMELRGLVRRLF